MTLLELMRKVFGVTPTPDELPTEEKPTALGCVAPITPRDPLSTYLAGVLAHAEADWKALVGIHDRTPGHGLDRMFKISGWSKHGVEKDMSKRPPDWCGMAVGTWLVLGGMHPEHARSFLHCANVEAFFTYGGRNNVNPARLRTKVMREGEWIPIKDAQAEAPRRWRRLNGDDAVPIGEDTFTPGDVVLIEWRATGRARWADHITMVKAWDYESKVLTLIEGNRRGTGYDGKHRTSQVVVVNYDLKDAKVRRQLYGVGRMSRFDFEDTQVR